MTSRTAPVASTWKLAIGGRDASRPAPMSAPIAAVLILLGGWTWQTVAPATAFAQGGQSRGTWAARSSTGLTLGGTWTVVIDPATAAATGSWTLVDQKQAVVARGSWSAAKSPTGWTGAWRAAAEGGGGMYAGTWAANLALEPKAPFAELFEKAAQSAISGSWAVGRLTGAWSIRASAGR